MKTPLIIAMVGREIKDRGKTTLVASLMVALAACGSQGNINARITEQPSTPTTTSASPLYSPKSAKSNTLSLSRNDIIEEVAYRL